MTEDKEPEESDRRSIQRKKPRRRISESTALRKKARATLEKYRKEDPAPVKPVVSEKTPAIKRCQNCYFCVGERKFGGSSWVQCSNPGRSTTVISSGSWVKSGLNLPCWRAP